MPSFVFRIGREFKKRGESVMDNEPTAGTTGLFLEDLRFTPAVQLGAMIRDKIVSPKYSLVKWDRFWTWI